MAPTFFWMGSTPNWELLDPSLGEVVKRGVKRCLKGGKGYFQNSGGSWLKGGVKKFRGGLDPG